MATFNGTAGADQILRDYLSPGVLSVGPGGLTGTSQGTSFDRIFALGGNDVIEFGDYTSEAYGGDGDDVLDARGIVEDVGHLQRYFVGGDGDDTMYGSDFSDYFGSPGFDIFEGAGGDDRMVGGAGNDVYFVDSVGDRVVDRRGSDDIVVTNLARYVIPAGIELLELSSPDFHVGIGNDADNFLTSYEGRCKLDGRRGDDYLYSANTVGGDLLIGGSGDDLLEAVAGDADRLVGGRGNDVFSMIPVFGPVGHHVIGRGDGAPAFEGAGRPRGDRIDVSGIDANERKDGQQALEFGGAGKGHLLLRNSGGDTLVLADTDRDGDFELRIRVEDGDSVRASDYWARDFIL